MRLSLSTCGTQRAHDPRTLSDELCSLKEGEERNTLCARLLIAEDGLLLEETEFFTAASPHARLT